MAGVAQVWVNGQPCACSLKWLDARNQFGVVGAGGTFAVVQLKDALGRPVANSYRFVAYLPTRLPVGAQVKLVVNYY